MGPLGVYVQDSLSETLHFPKLNSTNYYVWSNNMKVAFPYYQGHNPPSINQGYIP